MREGAGRDLCCGDGEGGFTFPPIGIGIRIHHQFGCINRIPKVMREMREMREMRVMGVMRVMRVIWIWSFTCVRGTGPYPSLAGPSSLVEEGWPSSLACAA